MKIYIAGKMTGDPLYRAKFYAAAQSIRDKGYIPLNPATSPDGLTNAEYMRICFAMMDVADAVLFLPCWMNSQGATLERAYCQYTGKRIFDSTEEIC